MSNSVAPKTITELKVSAHLMALESGLFCVFNSPGSAPPDASTGLPGVRLSAAPAPAGYSGEVAISGFNPGGWLGGADGAALVRVSGGPAQVLVTVYQDPEADHDAPKLQVIRLTDEAAAAALPAPAPAATPVPAVASDQPKIIEVAAHVYGRGDIGGRLGEWMGERGGKRWIEGFGVMPSEAVAATDIEYQAVLGRGWLSPWAEGGQFCGSRGMSLPILGLRIRLKGAAAAAYRLSVSATFVDGSVAGPVLDGEVCEASSLQPLEAFQITLEPRHPAQAGRARSEPTASKKAASAKTGRKPAAVVPSPDAAEAKKPGSGKTPPKRTPATSRRR